jgi:hypothetical protein
VNERNGRVGHLVSAATLLKLLPDTTLHDRRTSHAAHKTTRRTPYTSRWPCGDTAQHSAGLMAQTASFDVTTGVDLQEVDNAINQAQKEVAQRYDFKRSSSSAACR